MLPTRFHDDPIKKLKQLSDNTGIQVAEHIRRAINEYLRKQKRKGEIL
ncbi:MAG: ribbon-helix-helix domain-containing protein [Candidatus Brocadia sp.]|nr:ribbon-helix-helix domain-containing protein [Candidatus Brocadia sp.]